MPTTVNGVVGSLAWGQSTSSTNSSGGTTSTGSTTTSTTPTTTTTAPTGETSTTSSTEPSSTTSTTTAPATSSEPTAPATSDPMTTEGASDPAPAKTYSAPVAANDVSPMPDRLRDLIVQQSSEGQPMSTSLHSLVLRTPASESGMENPLAFDLVQRTRAQIIAQASQSMVAQANHTGDSVRALLGAAA